MSRNGWEHYDLQKEVNKSNIAQLLEMFKRESEKYDLKCVEFCDFDGKLSEKVKENILSECEFLQEGRILISLELTKRMTETN